MAISRSQLHDLMWALDGDARTAVETPTAENYANVAASCERCLTKVGVTLTKLERARTNAQKAAVVMNTLTTGDDFNFGDSEAGVTLDALEADARAMQSAPTKALARKIVFNLGVMQRFLKEVKKAASGTITRASALKLSSCYPVE